MKTNLQKFEAIVEELIANTTGPCCESSVFIGEIKGRVIRLSVMTKREAVDVHDFEGLNENRTCVE